nr:MAG TPA: hypothetical protein [Caudoviricetes sp.]
MLSSALSLFDTDIIYSFHSIIFQQMLDNQSITYLVITNNVAT